MPGPARTLTFLFTDIAGSTRLWEADPSRMGEALPRHDHLLRRIVAENGGSVFKSLGDGLCVVFEVAPDAVRSALECQIALLRELPDLKVRMGIHTGAAEERDGDFFGQPLNRVQRLMSAGHGGQILLSQATAELARDQLPENASLRSLGQHRLRDLERTEHVYQLLHPAIRENFPNLNTLDFLPNNLPAQITTFIGRESERREVRALLSEHRLVTLTGTGGAGKTRLALQVAADVLEDFPNGAWFVDLAPLTDPSLIHQAVASALGVKSKPGEGLLDLVIESARDSKMLLIVDNCEHLIREAAETVDTFLRGCPSARVLTTSRETLGIFGEASWRVPSLSSPPASAAMTVEALSQYEAVKLFIERAEAVHPSFAVTKENAPALAQICHQLDGIPLALELAAARTKALTLQGIADRLSDRFRLLTGGSRTAMARHQTLRAAIDWSHGLLSEEERVGLRRLSVFAGSFGLEAAEALLDWAPLEAWQAIDVLTQLVDKSLLIPDFSEDS
ncbi:MAG TPA: adenylate/guanylate cyclase domain-containing protein, partial [Fimbriimonadaceae bacterium]|nr:adenylate/guanylate cyclase domain-containing protein [Fimbriimonadaceae bacterium]